MSTSTIIEYRYIEYVEPLSNYEQGGYYAVHIDDCLQNRYRIVHKLGHGTFSTTWLALDLQTSRYVAIKVGTADADREEVNVLSRVSAAATSTSKAPDVDDASLIPVVADRFDIKGPHGTHLCFVTAPARCSLSLLLDESTTGLFQLEVGRSMAAQLALAVCFVHSQGYCHGYLHFGNILLQQPSSFNSLSVEELYAKYGAPRLEPVIRLDGEPNPPGVPSHAVLPVWLGKEPEDFVIAEAKLMLTDFGVAFRPSDRSRFESYTPLVIRPPEAFFEPTVPLSFASDIWSLACGIFMLMSQRPLIDGMLAPQDYITAQQVHLQGPLPSEWWRRWAKRPEWFDEAGKPLRNKDSVCGWDRLFEQDVQESRRRLGMTCVDDQEKAALLELLQRMLTWRPTERPSVEEVLEMPWMKKWALPAYANSQKAWARGL